MIGGIFGTIGKTLGIGKEKYFLELDDAAEESVDNIKEAAVKATKVTTKAAKSVASDIVDKAQDLTGDTVDKAQDAAGDAVDKAKATASKAEAQTKKAAAKGKAKAKAVATDLAEKGEAAAEKAGDKAEAAGKKAKNTVKDTAKKAKKTAKKTVAKEVEKVAAAEPTAKLPPATPARDPEDIIRDAIAASGRPVDASGNVVGGPTNFSTDYLMMPTGNKGRRRPGPSLSPFKDMAKQTNPRLKN